jgi:hypothetical protein
MNSLIQNIEYFTMCPKFKANYCYYLFKMYNGNDWNWYKNNYCKNDDFNRVTIYKDNLFQLMLINWKKDYYTDFHNHPENGCLLKVLDGSLLEHKLNNENEVIIANQLKKNSISYSSGIDIHKIIAVDDSVSLHLYSPPIGK